MKRLTYLVAAGALLATSGLGAWTANAATDDSPAAHVRTAARHGADDPAGHHRHGADDLAGHQRDAEPEPGDDTGGATDAPEPGDDNGGATEAPESGDDNGGDTSGSGGHDGTDDGSHHGGGDDHGSDG
jgi:hypothetical protein